MNEAISDENCQFTYSGSPSSQTICSGGPNKNQPCSIDLTCQFRISPSDRIIAWAIDPDDANNCKNEYEKVDEGEQDRSEPVLENVYTCENLNLAFKLGGGGESVQLFKDGIDNQNLIDGYDFQQQTGNTSMARCAGDGVGSFVQVPNGGTFNSPNTENQCLDTLYKFSDNEIIGIDGENLDTTSAAIVTTQDSWANYSNIVKFLIYRFLTYSLVWLP